MSKIVFTNGCFDVLHPAHFKQLVYCRKLAGKDGKVIVALDSDGKVRQDKGAMRPIFDQEARKQAVWDLVYPSDSGEVIRLVDDVKLFDTNEELLELVREVNPDYLVKGGEWKGNVVGSDVAKQVVLMKMDSNYSSTKTIEAITSRFITNIIAAPASKEPSTLCSCDPDGTGYHSYDCMTGCFKR